MGVHGQNVEETPVWASATILLDRIQNWVQEVSARIDTRRVMSGVARCDVREVRSGRGGDLN